MLPPSGSSLRGCVEDFESPSQSEQIKGASRRSLERSERAFVAGQYRLRPEFQIALPSCDPRFVTAITIHFVCTGNVRRRHT
jgi:hypothetical protein